MSFRAARVYAGNDLEFSDMDKTRSRDGTAIAYDHTGHGPPVILVVGAFNDRSTGAPLAAALAARFTVFRYDRRGRGDSGDTPPYAVDREVEDLRAVIERAGGPAAVLGFSSGAALALTAAAHGLPIARLALYDLPLIADGPLGRAQRIALPAADHGPTLAALVAGSRRGDAVEYFQSRVVGIPAPVVAQLRRAPFRPALEAMAHTLAYEAAIVGSGELPADLATTLAAVAMPVLALAGATSPPFMRETAAALAAALPDCRAQVVDGAGHDLAPDALAPVLASFFAG